MLRDRVVFVTGASSGIGRACARAFAREGARLIVAARRLERLHALEPELSQLGAPAVYVDTFDVRDAQAVAARIEALPAEWREIDVLINNAGLSRGLDVLHEGKLADWNEMIDTNVKGLLWVTRSVLPGMVERRGGHIINIGSVAGHEVYPGGSVYCATKHAVAALNRCLGIDTLGTGVRVSSVDPGMVETEFSLVRFHGDAERADGVYEGFEALRGEDVAEAVIFCATRPPHANVREMILMPAAQATAVHSHRTR